MLGMSGGGGGGFIKGDSHSHRDRLLRVPQEVLPTLAPPTSSDHTGFLSGAFTSPSNAAAAAMFAGFQQNPNLWKCLGASPPPVCDWAMNCVSGGGGGALYNSYPRPDDVPAVSVHNNDPSSAGQISMCDTQRGGLYSSTSYPPSPFYPNGHLQEMLAAPAHPSALVGHHHQQALEMTTALGHPRGAAAQVSDQTWQLDGGSELALQLPTDARSRLNIDEHAIWGMRGGKFLSLSSNPPPPDSAVVNPLENRPEPSQQGFGGVMLKSAKGSDALSADESSSYHAAAPSGGRNNNIPPPHGVAGPLGPFTGYAAILKSSKFLRPAQQLLDESCGAAAARAPPLGMLPQSMICGPQNVASSSHMAAAAAAVSVNSGNIDGGFGCINSSGPAASSSVHCSSAAAAAGEGGGLHGGGNGGESHGPQIQQKKAKLLFMQGEVCRKYKHYSQQMQMAISSFESVAGLSSAIPYLSLAIKSVSKHFRFLKGVISEQLVGMSRALGEDYFASMHASCMGDDVVLLSSQSQQRFLDQALRRHNKGEDGGGLVVEHCAPVWRPQRGLPDRAVAVLRAWLFDHFLHPYPTDTDKLMLATQTGLTRNQVSNWFINARVRVWKPMVEEIHMLETKGLAEEVDLNSSSKNDDAANSNANTMARFSTSGKHHQVDQQAGLPSSDCSSIEPAASQRANCSGVVAPWQLEKRPRTDHYPMVESVESGGVMVGFPHYQGGGFDMAGLGVGGVSLTLGLRQEDGAPPYHQQIISRPPFGVQMVHNFVS